jgi:single-strand DNA-binding protein
MSVNRATLLGHLGADPEMRTTASGQHVCTLRIATDSNWTDKSGKKQEATEWHRVVLWGRLAEIAEQYLKQGQQVYLEGRLQTREWLDRSGQKRYSTEIVAHNLQLVGRPARKESEQAEAGLAEAALPAEVIAELEKF